MSVGEVENIHTARLESLEKVKSAWRNIIEKYSSLGENEQGDVLDMRTGNIVQDAGHLRSMRDSTQVKGNVWGSLLAAELGELDDQKDDHDATQQKLVIDPRTRKVKKLAPAAQPLFEAEQSVVKSISILTDSEEDGTDDLLDTEQYFLPPRQSGRRTTRSSIAQKDNLSIVPVSSERVPEQSCVRRVRRPEFSATGDDPLKLTPPAYDETYEDRGKTSKMLFKVLPSNASGPIITPTKVRRFKEALARKSESTGNARLKKLLWQSKKRRTRTRSCSLIPEVAPAGNRSVVDLK